MDKHDKIIDGLKKVTEGISVEDLVNGIGYVYISIITKDGVEGISISGGIDSTRKKFVVKHTEDIKAMKKDIITYLKDRQAKEKKSREDYQKKVEDEKHSKISSGKAHLALVRYGHYNIDTMIAFMENVGTTGQGAWERDNNHQIVKEVHELKNKKIIDMFTQTRKPDGCYNDGIVYYITDKESKDIINQDNQVEKAKKEVAEVQKLLNSLKAKEEEANALTRAKATGKPQVIRGWMDECNDPKEECSLDRVSLMMNPDGTTTTVRTHTW
jgi:hypothetical protein